MNCDVKGVNLSLLHEVIIAPSQTRIVPVLLSQSEAFMGDKLLLEMMLFSNASDSSEEVALLSVEVVIRQISHWESKDLQAIKATYLYAGSQPTAFLAVPPILRTNGSAENPVLALRMSI